MTALAAAVGALGGAVLYLVGTTYFRSYYEQWGLDAAMFPTSTDQTIVQGYHAVMNEFAKAVVAVLREYWLWMVVYALVIWAGAMLVFWVEGRLRKRVAAAVRRYEGAARGVVALAASLGLVVAIPFAAMVAAFLLLAWPLTAADRYGRDVVKLQLAEFKQGCDSAAVSSKCVALTRGGVNVARGFLVGAGERVLAVYEPTANRTVLVERDGLVLVGAPRGMSSPASQAGQ